MEQIIAVTQREFLVRVKRRAFIVASLMAPALMLAWIIIPAMLLSSSIVERKVTVLDQSGDPELFKSIEDHMNNFADGTRFKLTRVEVPQEADADEVRRQYTDQITSDPASAYIVLRPSVMEDQQPEYYAENTSDTSIANLSHTISSVITQRRIVKAGVDSDRAARFLKRSDLKLVKVTKEGESQDRGQGLALPLIMFFVMYMVVAGYGQRVMMGVIEEKQSKVVEVVISSVKPFELMMGKLLGIGLVGLAQLLIWVTFAVGLALLGKGLFSRFGLDLSKVPYGLMAYFFVYFILGYFMFGTIYAIVGAMTSRPEDVALLQRPLRLLNLIPLFSVWIVMRDPNSALSVVLSMIPLFSPPLMVLRVAIVSPPIWQIALSIVLILLTIYVAIWVAAKVYRVGILLYGKRPTLIQIGRWLKYA